MNPYRISFYDKNALDPQDRDQIQRTIVNAESEQKAIDIFSFTNCEVISVELLVSVQAFTFADYKADYQERNDLYVMGNGG
jgi:hypothetical protein